MGPVTKRAQRRNGNLMDPRQLADEQEIRRLRERWAFGRDYGDWDEIAACFHPGATISISWYEGDIAGFIEGSRKLNAKRAPDERGKHWLGGARYWIEGDRAVAETDAMILGRVRLDGHLFDTTTWARFYDLVERRDGDWKIVQWKMIYDADRMDAVEPGKVPASFHENIDLSPYPAACAHLCYRLAKSGQSVGGNIVSRGSEAEAACKDEGRRWLAGGPV